MVLLALLVIFVTIGFYLLYSKYNEARKKLESIPGPPSLPIFGNLVEVARQGNPAFNMIPYLTNLFHIYGGRTKLYFGWNTNLVLANAEDLEKLLSSQTYINRGDNYAVLEDYFGLCLTTANGDIWRRKRKMLQPSFNVSVLESFVPIVDKQCQIFCEILSLKEKGGQELDMSPLISHCLLDIITETAMGCEMKCQAEGDSTYAIASREIMILIIKRWFNPLLQVDFIWRNIPQGKEWEKHKETIHGITRRVIAERKAKRSIQSKSKAEEGKIEPLAFLDTLLQLQEDDPSCLSDEDIRKETNLFISAGNETTASAMQSFFMRIGYHSDVQKKIQVEVDEMFGSKDDKQLNSNDLRSLNYTEMVIKEVMRLYPVAPVTMRHIGQPLALDSKTIVPAGVTALVNSYALHRDPKVFPNPEQFIPERFTAEECRKRHPYAYIPFSAGPRNCLGYKFAMMQMKMIVAHTLRKFDVTGTRKLEEIKLELSGTLKPNGGVFVKLNPRS